MIYIKFLNSNKIPILADLVFGCYINSKINAVPIDIIIDTLWCIWGLGERVDYEVAAVGYVSC